MDPLLLARLERLAAAGIELVPAPLASHFLLVRDGFVSLVERRDGGFGEIGAPGLLLEVHGFAALVWRDGTAHFVGRGYDRPAAAGEIDQLRAFDRALHEALAG